MNIVLLDFEGGGGRLGSSGGSPRPCPTSWPFPLQHSAGKGHCTRLGPCWAPAGAGGPGHSSGSPMLWVPQDPPPGFSHLLLR